MKASYALCTRANFNSINTPGASTMTGSTNEVITYGDYSNYIAKYGGFDSLTDGSLVATGKTRATTASTLCVRYDDLAAVNRRISAKLMTNIKIYLIGKSVSGVTGFGTITNVSMGGSGDEGNNAPLSLVYTGTTGTSGRTTMNITTGMYSLLGASYASIRPESLGKEISVTGSTGMTGKLLNIPFTSAINSYDINDDYATFYLNITPNGTPVIDPSSTGTSASISVTYVGGSWQVKNNSSRTIYYKAMFSPAASPQSFSWEPSSASTTPATSVAAGATGTFGAPSLTGLGHMEVFWSTNSWSGTTGYMYTEVVKA